MLSLSLKVLVLYALVHFTFGLVSRIFVLISYAKV